LKKNNRKNYAGALFVGKLRLNFDVLSSFLGRHFWKRGPQMSGQILYSRVTIEHVAKFCVDRPRDFEDMGAE